MEALEIDSPASIWVDSTVRGDGLDPTSTPYAGLVQSLVEVVQTWQCKPDNLVKREVTSRDATESARKTPRKNFLKERGRPGAWLHCPDLATPWLHSPRKQNANPEGLA